MKLKLITTWTCLVALLLISSLAYAVVPVSVGPAGVTFPDNTVQSTSAVLPACSSGEVIVNNLGAWMCGTILPVDRGIATCVLSVCSISACQPTFGNCDANALNGCETPLTTTLNCGACGNACGANQICSTGTCVTSPNAPLSLSASGTPTAGFINNQRPVVVTANVQQVAGGPVPVGTTVNFAITSGSGTLSAASATTDALGNASVTLNSTVEGSVTVTATAAPATNSAIIAFSNPNKPGTVVLAANPLSGIANNVVPVTMTATVSPVDLVNGAIANGTPVTFNILSGTGTLSSATATTINGVASVTLNSTVAGSVGVSASAGTSPIVNSTTVTVPFITQPTQAIVTVALSGTGTIGGSTIVVDNASNKGLGTPTVQKIAIGIDADIFAANTTVTNKVTIGSAWSLGALAGNVARLTYPIAAGNFPQAGDFSINLAGTSIIDVNNQPLPTVTATISVSIQ